MIPQSGANNTPSRLSPTILTGLVIYIASGQPYSPLLMKMDPPSGTISKAVYIFVGVSILEPSPVPSGETYTS